jgi:prepilin-type N-terminal cleavage/methylation domain-containing protein
MKQSRTSNSSCITSRRQNAAFTLIELLITVAIIAILAAVAVPNFLEAQTRAKISRVKTDLRTLATAIEAYSVDNNHPMFDGQPNTEHWGWVSSFKQATTPVAYITTIPADLFQDPIMKTAIPPPGQTFFIDDPAHTKHSYDYGTATWHQVGYDPGQTGLWMASLGNSRWKIGSCGPDGQFINTAGFFGFGPSYDPTNGTVSIGDIYRSAAVVQ